MAVGFPNEGVYRMGPGVLREEQGTQANEEQAVYTGAHPLTGENPGQHTSATKTQDELLANLAGIAGDSESGSAPVTLLPYGRRRSHNTSPTQSQDAPTTAPTENPTETSRHQTTPVSEVDEDLPAEVEAGVFSLGETFKGILGSIRNRAATASDGMRNRKPSEEATADTDSDNSPRALPPAPSSNQDPTLKYAYALVDGVKTRLEGTLRLNRISNMSLEATGIHDDPEDPETPKRKGPLHELVVSTIGLARTLERTLEQPQAQPPARRLLGRRHVITPELTPEEIRTLGDAIANNATDEALQAFIPGMSVGEIMSGYCRAMGFTPEADVLSIADTKHPGQRLYLNTETASARLIARLEDPIPKRLTFSYDPNQDPAVEEVPQGSYVTRDDLLRKSKGNRAVGLLEGEDGQLFWVEEEVGYPDMSAEGLNGHLQPVAVIPVTQRGARALSRGSAVNRKQSLAAMGNKMLDTPDTAATSMTDAEIDAIRMIDRAFPVDVSREMRSAMARIDTTSYVWTGIPEEGTMPVDQHARELESSHQLPPVPGWTQPSNGADTLYESGDAE